MTDILNPETQERLHRENQEAIADIRSKLDRLISEHEEQNRALRIIIGGPVSDMEVLMRFWNEHHRLIRYDRRITDVAETMAQWITRGILAGSIVLVVVGMAYVGVFDSIKALMGRN